MSEIISNAWLLVTTIGADVYIYAGLLFALALYVINALGVLDDARYYFDEGAYDPERVGMDDDDPDWLN